MTIYVPSYHKQDRIISPDLNRPETIFVIRPEQKNWYKENFPLAKLECQQTEPPGLNCLIQARNWILDHWRKNAPKDEVFAWMCDDDWTGFTYHKISELETRQKTINKKSKVKNKTGTPSWGAPKPTNEKVGERLEIGLDEAYKLFISLADENTRIIGPTNSNSEMAFNPNTIRTNKGEAPESCYLISKYCQGYYALDTFENQQISAEQVKTGGNFKVVQAVELKYYNDASISTLFSDPKFVAYTLQMCENTIKLYPNLFDKPRLGTQKTYKLKFRDNLNINQGVPFEFTIK